MWDHEWDRNLTDHDGPYIELMAGVYTDNQPDFSFLAPGETKTFRQYWYPFRKIEPVQEANAEAAVSLKSDGPHIQVGVYTTRPHSVLRVDLESDTGRLAQWITDVSPGNPLFESTTISASNLPHVRLRVITQDGKELALCTPAMPNAAEVPAPATEPPEPAAVTMIDELYLTGLHLDQYRHARRQPEAYWLEGLRRDPGDARCNNALRRCLRSHQIGATL